jgi:CO/xanthine dehydrogenase Mo-binding subunit
METNLDLRPDETELQECEFWSVPVQYDFGVSRRGFVQFLGAGILLAVTVTPSLAQRSGGRRGGFGGSGPKNLAARIHLGKDGSITVLAGKVEAGQGARSELTQAAAEELGVSSSAITLILADTGRVPDDGITAGSGTTPRTVPAVRRAGSAARKLLIDFAARTWGVDAAQCEIKDGKVTHAPTHRSLSYADLAASDEAAKNLQEAIPSDVATIPAQDWKVLGTSVMRANGEDIVRGRHKYPSDIQWPGMLYGKVLRAPSYGAKLASVDLEAARSVKGAIPVRDEQFVAVAAPTRFAAAKAVEALAQSAKWETPPQPSSAQIFDYLRDNAQGGVSANPFKDELSSAKKTLKQRYQVAYVQHAPLEPRAAVAEWENGKVTVWAGTQNPFGHRGELARVFHIPEENTRVIVPDFGAGFGGKHTPEATIEAARIAKTVEKPVSLCWTREEEFTWAYFRPAGDLHVEASLDDKGRLTSWHFININSGPSAIETPYRVGQNKSQYVASTPPLRHGSYRGLAATANTFARECFMDELAGAASMDPLEFRLAHLENPRLRAVLEAAAKKFDWKTRNGKKNRNTGVGLACGTEKGSYVAACVEIEVDPAHNAIQVKHVCEAFECGAIVNPDNLLKQVQGAIIMGLGPALSEEVRFENGKMLNAAFRRYVVPRFADVPEIQVELVNRPDLQSAGAGETPIIAIAPAIANAVFHATAKRVRSMPIRLAST